MIRNSAELGETALLLVSLLVLAAGSYAIAVTSPADPACENSQCAFTSAQAVDRQEVRFRQLEGGS